ncbi:MAG TPA: GH1 family beta-glucosidase [Candidatus Limnocylindria bacterium]|nr:GH1 family beta-glucosidase [Candidatus Limnocylindria bacterium]
MTSSVAEGQADAAEAAALAGRFPPGFAFGVASSAYQIEGAAAEDGRGPSIWDTFSHTPGRTRNGETGDVACDHYHRWREDVALMRELGMASYRFSVSWSRVLPEGIGTVNEPGLDFYDALVDGLLAAGITPLPTLYHWDLPQALYDRGGWTSSEAPAWFAEYSGVIAERLGDRVKRWLTLNEPMVFAFVANAYGRHAPGLTDWHTALRVADGALRGHAAAANQIRATVSGAEIGIALDPNWVEPASDSAADAEAANRHLTIEHRWFADPLFGRPYPEIAVRAHRDAGHLPVDIVTDRPPIAGGTLDFLGLNYYTREVIAADSDAPFGLRVAPLPDVQRTSMGWEVYPAGLLKVLNWLRTEYAPPEIMITENGSAFHEPALAPDADVVDDPERTRFLADHLAVAAQAINEGIPLTGYYAWSLLDNFEWAEGYAQRFGIVHVDYPTQRRIVKRSGRLYQAVAQAHRSARG